MMATRELEIEGGCDSCHPEADNTSHGGEEWQRNALSRVLSRVVERLEPPSLVESLRSQGDIAVEELFDALTEEGLLRKEGPPSGSGDEICTMPTLYKDFEVSGKLKSLVGHADCLVITSTGPVDLQLGAVPKLPSTDGSGIQDEVRRIVELIDGDRRKELPVLGPYRVEGEGRVVPVWVDGLGTRHSKKFYLKLIEDFLAQCKKQAVLIWYSGHGQRGSGNWCFKDDVLGLEELLMLYETHFRGRLLTVVTDCCFSGHWAYQLAGIMDQKGIPPCGHRAEEEGYLLQLFAACQPYERPTMCCYSSEGVSAGKEGLIKFEMQADLTRQKTCGIDTTRLGCSVLERGFSCGVSLQNVGWRDIPQYQSLNRYIHLIHEGNGWLYLLIYEEDEATFRVKVREGIGNLVQHGRVLCSGWGEEPPPDVSRAVAAFFDLRPEHAQNQSI